MSAYNLFLLHMYYYPSTKMYELMCQPDLEKYWFSTYRFTFEMIFVLKSRKKHRTQMCEV